MRAGEFWLSDDFAQLAKMVAQLVLGPFAEFFAGIFRGHDWDLLYSSLTLLAWYSFFFCPEFADMSADADDTNAEPLPTVPRSPELMRPDDTGLLVIDVQERLIAVEPNGQRVVWNIRRLLDGAKILGVQSAATEQYPEKLGGTVPELATRLSSPPASKQTFSCRTCDEIFTAWRAAGIHRILVCGIETHVCVQQTVLDLLAAGFQVVVAVDAVTSRFTIDYETALRRMETSGALLTTTEAALFEWCGTAGTAEFKRISALAKETCPE